MSDFRAVPLSQAQANDYISKHHRHHKPVRGDKFLVGVESGGKLVGVVMVGRPVSRELDDGFTVEILRCCTDGTKNACSFLYARAAKAAKVLGFNRIYTYIQESEDGTSLRAAGFEFDKITKGGSWNCPSRPRETQAPQCRKLRFVKWLS